MTLYRQQERSLSQRQSNMKNMTKASSLTSGTQQAKRSIALLRGYSTKTP